MTDRKASPSIEVANYNDKQCILPSLSAMAVLRSEHLPDLSRFAPASKSMNHLCTSHNTFTSNSLSDRWKMTRQSDPHTIPARQPDAPQDRLEAITEAETAQSELDLYDRFLNDAGSLANRVLFPRAESPLFHAIFADMERLRGFSNELERQLDQALGIQEGMLQLIGDQSRSHDDTESWIDLVSGGRRESVPDMPKDEPSAAEQKPIDGKATFNIVFNRSQSETRTLSDGSIWRKTITTKRFADGREETDESVEVHRPSPDTIHPGDPNEKNSSDNHVSEKPKGGWFWKE